jgi:LmbE family N-acetylglucosaminyl deacetylase|tara:strand:- start:4422 stop:5051 length:630 start_codon:yes stop_codon:yes gene_type:complete
MVKKLVISPHIDDEVLGCGGILDKDTFVLYCGVENRYVNGDMSISVVTRINELKKVSKFLNFDFKLLDNKVNNFQLKDLIGEFEEVISRLKPQQIYIPYPSYNQDHRIVYEASLIATRPHDINFFVKKVLVYEQPHVFFWDKTHNINSGFVPNYFIPIDINKKIKAYELMKTQVRSFRSSENLKSMANLRGTQSNNEYAEAFQILRWVD